MQKFNPFRPGHAVTPGMFAGRLNEIKSLERGLFQTKNGNPQHFLLEGERGIGKTSLMLYLDWVARGDISANGEKFKFLVVSIELTEGMTPDDLLERILAGLRQEMANREPLKKMCGRTWEFLAKFEVLGCSFDNSKQESSSRFEDLVTTLISIITEGKSEIDGIVLLVDEADKSAVSTRLGEVCKLLTERLTRKGCERLAIFLAGLTGLVEQIKIGHESAPRIFEVLPLEPLEMAERIEVIHRGLEIAEEKNGFATKIESETSTFLADLSEGYPHFLQQFSFCAFEEDTDNNIDNEDVRNGAFAENGAIDQLGRKYYSNLYKDQIGSEDYRKVLICMSEHLDGWVERQYLIDKSGVKSLTVDNALRALKDRRIIIPNPEKKGQYKLPTKSFAIWIKVQAQIGGI